MLAMAESKSNHSEQGVMADGPGIQSVEIAGRILRALAEQGGSLYLRELAAAAGMPRAKLHRYLKSLCRAELVEQDAETGRYNIGPAAISLGLIGLYRANPVRLAYSMMPAISDALNETVFAAVWSERGPTVVALEEPANAVTINLRVGSSVPLLTSAMGRVFAAYLPRARTAGMMDAEANRPGSPAGDVLETLLDEIRRDGVAAIEGLLLPGINAIGAPVFNHHGRIALVIGVVGHAETLDVSLNARPVAVLRDSAASLSRRIGFNTLYAAEA